MKDFPARLQKLMEKREVNQSELSRYTGVSQQAISFYLSGKVEPQSIEILYKLSKYFRVSLFELTGLEITRGIEKRLADNPELTEKAEQFAEAYNGLPEDDWRRRAISDMLRTEFEKRESESHDKEDSEKKDKK